MTEKEAIENIKRLLENANPFTMSLYTYHSLKTVIQALEQKDKELKEYKENALFLCDPDKNKECKKTSCYINGGECVQTTDIKFRKER